ncbi:hypothetical protein BJ508DRAFT_211097 [Ascobolus immersus RN42]|uniref:Tc1-like transposase DDE domain-containing protein n=1 Tax=Ascobolus immersus RN42 TaxID=1160509 RepID=A0A3N4I256_ASCIM|nr:hypothetical protein BJ508DRAFT_211097 [Ascobolus immersus RN42]
MVLYEYGTNGYWTGEKMLDHIVRIAILIFRYAFPPNFRALFAFDNASNHRVMADNALIASKMNRGPGGKQPFMRDGHIKEKNYRIQPMVFSPDLDPEDPNYRHRGKQKGIEQVLKERDLFRTRRVDGFAFKLECKSGTCDPTLEGGCCMRMLLSIQNDFLAQTGRLEEEIKARGHFSSFYPKFHCELNFIERYWCSVKHYARNNCKYDLRGLRETIPHALDSVSTASIHRYYMHCMHILDAYRDPTLRYGSQEFTERVYKGHRAVVDKTKY